MFGRKSKEIKELEAKIRSIEMDKEWNIIHYQEETQRLEKALDKACERLKILYIEKNKCEECGECWNMGKCKKCWKKYLLESEKDGL